MTTTIKSLPELDIKTLEGLSQHSDIPLEWLKPNVLRTKEDDGWVFIGYGQQPQIRYDVPTINKETGKQIRYKSQPGTKADISIPKNQQGKPITSDYSPENTTIVITEGLKKAIKASSVDIPTVSVSGVWNGLQKQDDGSRKICPTLQELINKQYLSYIITFDADCATKPDVIKAAIELAVALINAGCTVKIATGLWQEIDGKGMDDFISKNGADAMRAILERAYSLEAWEREVAAPILDSCQKKRRTSGKKTHAEVVEELSDFYGDRIRLNEMTNEIEKDGKEYYIDSSFIHISQDAGIELTKGYAIDYLVEIARNNSYHPVVNYLDSVKGLTAEISSDDSLLKLHDLLTKITGVTDKLHLTFLTKTLVAAVTRIYNPGCFFKRVCVLYGKQDAGKSSFWRELAGDKFFSDSYKGTTDKDDLMSLHSAWINEISEFDKVYRKTDVANLKGVISSPFDKIRLPYAKSIVTLFRRSILTATTNRNDILQDSTGSNRFWVVNIPRAIDFEALIGNRDLIWSLVYKLYKSGYSYELSSDEKKASEANNEAYTNTDPLYYDVLDACRVRDDSEELAEYVVLRHIYGKLHDDYDGKTPLTRSQWYPIGEVLRSLGYVSGDKKYINGKMEPVWVCEDTKKFVQGTVGTVGNSETVAAQVLPMSYCLATDAQRTVARNEEQVTEMLPMPKERYEDGSTTVATTVQGFQAFPTVATAPDQNKSENTHSQDTHKKFRLNCNQFATYGTELVKIVGGNGKKWQVEHRKPDGSFGGFTNNVPTAQLKHPDLATVNHW